MHPDFTLSKPSRRRLLGVATALWLSACAPVTPQLQPPVEPPAAFSAAGDQALPERWWLALDDPGLDGLIERALAGNLSLQSAWDRLDQARALARRAGADLYPSLDAEASVSHLRLREGGETSSSDELGLGLVAGYELDLWGRIRSSREAALLDARASADDLQTAALTLSAQVAATWYQLVEQYGQLELLEAQRALNQQVLELVTLQFRTGQAGIADVLQQRQLVESNRGERAQAEARAGLLEHQLAILLGSAPGEPVAPRQSGLLELPSLPATGLPAELVQRRPDLRGAWHRVLASDRNLAAAIAERFPRLSLTAQLSTSGGKASDLFNDWLTSLAGNLIGPLVDGGFRRAEIDRARALAAEDLHTYGQAVLDAFGEVEDALLQERRQRELIASLDRQLELAATVIERVRDRYTKGAVDYQRVLDALLSHQQLQRTRLSAQRELIQNRIDLYRALGGGWELARGERVTSLTSTGRD
ncbi:membrane protein [Desulfuromonas versatilis]|uniref:Membrane protein n=1 Tax=Desulfuromonas versatilis TaxID=2802975 RepID=A0ABM8HWY8_9BACT|nr:TolC family protein [Desulfuromonas versatilis]BCR06462.1 membrane protein [Desulfuromonas versatilis]